MIFIFYRWFSFLWNMYFNIHLRRLLFQNLLVILRVSHLGGFFLLRNSGLFSCGKRETPCNTPPSPRDIKSQREWREPLRVTMIIAGHGVVAFYGATLTPTRSVSF